MAAKCAVRSRMTAVRARSGGIVYVVWSDPEAEEDDDESFEKGWEYYGIMDTPKCRSCI